MDRKDGTGQARRGDKKGGHGKGNWGKDGEGVYKKKGAEEETKEEAPAEVEEEKEDKTQYVEEVIGYSLDDFLKDKTQTAGKKEARQGAKISAKVEAVKDEKVHQSTILKNQYQKGAIAKTTGQNGALLGFQAEEYDAERGDRGDRRGGRGGAADAGRGGGRKQNARQALKKTEDDFPTL